MTGSNRTPLWMTIMLMMGSYPFGLNLHNIMHELDHAAAVWVQGGSVAGFHFHPFEACLNLSSEAKAADSTSSDSTAMTTREMLRSFYGYDPLEPPPVLPVREGDYGRYPRENFAIFFETGHGEMVDTYGGLVTKDMVVKPDTTISLVLTEAELDTLYKKVIEIRFFDYPEPHPPRESNVHISHNIRMVLRVRAGTVEKTLRWKTGRLPKGDAVNDWKRIEQLIRLIREIVRSRPEYRALPSSEGAYI